MKWTTVLAVILVGLVWGLPGRGEDKDNEKPCRAEIGADGIQHIEIVGGSYFFRPKHVIVRVNVPVELTVCKESGFVPHNIVMKSPEAGIEFDESLSTDPKIIKFTPTKVGRYSFYCSKKLLFFESHREKGMEGVLEVVE